MKQTRGTVVVAMTDTHAEVLHQPRPVTIGTLPALRILREEILNAGFEFADMRHLRRMPAHPVYVLWDFGSFAVLPRVFHDVPPRRVIAWALESPLVAHRAFHRLDSIAARSGRILTFPGAAALLTDTTSFRPILYPNDPVVAANDPPWVDRELLVMISTNKSVRPSWGSVQFRHPYRSVRRVAAGILAASYRIRGRWEALDLYPERIRAIEHFSQRDDFSLFGTGWSPLSLRSQGAAIARSYRGAVRDKHETLAGFRFALCFENTRFPGYITEKLFDCFFSKAIPIYFGAPDIKEYVSSKAFIGLERFTSYAELERYIVEMDPSQANAYLDEAAAFLDSADASSFRSEWFVKTIMRALEDAAAES